MPWRCLSLPLWSCLNFPTPRLMQAPGCQLTNCNRNWEMSASFEEKGLPALDICPHSYGSNFLGSRLPKISIFIWKGKEPIWEELALLRKSLAGMAWGPPHTWKEKVCQGSHCWVQLNPDNRCKSIVLLASAAPFFPHIHHWPGPGIAVQLAECLPRMQSPRFDP